MAGAGEAIAAHAAVVFVFVARLSVTGQPHDHITSLYVVDNQVVAFHSGEGRVAYVDGADDVAHIGCFAARKVQADTVGCHFFHKIHPCLYERTDDLAGDEVLVPSDGGGDEDAVRAADAGHVVKVHHEGVLGNTFPDAEVAGFPPIEVGEAGLRACRIGVHDIAMFIAACYHVGQYFAKSHREKPLVEVLDGSMDFVLAGGNAPEVVFVRIGHLAVDW